MRPDLVSLVAKKDILICAFGARYIKIHREKHFVNVASRKMRELAKLLIEIKTLDLSIKNLLEALKPKCFDLLVRATKIVAKYDENKDYYLSPTYAMNIRTSLKQCCDIAILLLLKKKDIYANIDPAEGEVNLRTTIQLLDSHWKFDISSQAADDLNTKRWNKVSLVPLASDIKLLKEYLTLKSNNAASILTKNETDLEAYTVLLETIFCRIILLNRKRPGELQRIFLHVYENVMKHNTQNYEEFGETISPAEKILMQKFKRVVIRGKRGRGVPVLLGTDVQEHIKLLLQCRSNFVGKENPYLFGKPKLKAPICGYKVLRKYAISCGAKNSQAITCTRLRKHLATITQIFNMSNNDIEQLATFMGHTSDVHRKAYRLPDDVYQTAKISKLLLLMEKGLASEFKGKSIDEIELNLDGDLLAEEINDTDEEFNVLSEEINETNKETYKENEPMCTNKNINQKPKRNLVPWTKQQKELVNSYFENHIKKKMPPKKRECEMLKEKHPDAFQNKTWLKIKVNVQNIYCKKLKY